MFGGGLTCLALADQNAMGFISTIHELASAERKFYCTLSKVKSQIWAPFCPVVWNRLFTHCSFVEFVDCYCVDIACTHSVVMQLVWPCLWVRPPCCCFKSWLVVSASFAIWQEQHSVSLTNVLQRGKVIKTLVLIKNTDIFMDTYKEWVGVGDMTKILYHDMTNFISR